MPSERRRTPKQEKLEALPTELSDPGEPSQSASAPHSAAAQPPHAEPATHLAGPCTFLRREPGPCYTSRHGPGGFAEAFGRFGDGIGFLLDAELQVVPMRSRRSVKACSRRSAIEVRSCSRRSRSQDEVIGPFLGSVGFVLVLRLNHGCANRLQVWSRIILLRIAGNSRATLDGPFFIDCQVVAKVQRQ